MIKGQRLLGYCNVAAVYGVVSLHRRQGLKIYIIIRSIARKDTTCLENKYNFAKNPIFFFATL